ETYLGIVQDRRLPCGIFLDAVGAKGGIDGDGNRSGEKNPRIGYEEGARSRQHQRDASAGGHTTPRQLRGAAVSGGIELAKGQRTAAFPGITVLGDPQVRAQGVVRGAIPQHLDERLGGADSSVRSCPVQLLSRHRSPQHGAGFDIFDVCSWSGQNGARQILRSIGLRSHASGKRMWNVVSSRASSSTRSRLPSPKSRSSCESGLSSGKAPWLPSSSSKPRITSRTRWPTAERSS